MGFNQSSSKTTARWSFSEVTDDAIIVAPVGAARAGLPAPDVKPRGPDGAFLEESREGVQARAKSVPAMSGVAERRCHRLTHWPYRSFCKAFVVGSGREDVQHRTEARRETPQSGWTPASRPSVAPKHRSGRSQVLDAESSEVETRAVQDKGSADYPVRAVCQAIKVVVQEAHRVDLRPGASNHGLVKGHHGGSHEENVEQHGPRMHSKSLGPTEAAG